MEMERILNWTQHLGMIRDAYNLTDDITRIILTSKLKGKAIAWFHSRPEHLTLLIDILI